MNPTETLKHLIKLSHELGREDRHFTILGEGNVSADLGDGTFYIKGSGSNLATINENGFTRVNMTPILQALDGPAKTDTEVQTILEACCIEKGSKLPSVETFLHAICLKEGGAKWIGHVHTTSVLKILSSKLGAKPFHRHIFPDAIVVCGRYLAEVPYVDPGIRLAIELRNSLHSFIDKHKTAPKVILMVNHGPVILGQTERDVLNTMLMLDKWATILAATYAMGGPKFLDEELSNRIENRLDEHHRRKIIGKM